MLTPSRPSAAYFSPWLRARSVLAFVSSLAAALACGSDSFKPEPLAEPPVLYWQLTLNHHAVTLSTTAPYDMLTLVATPRNYRGDPLPGLPAPTYTTRDAESVIVTAEGRLIAQRPTNTPVLVYATLTSGNLKHVDSVLVKVATHTGPTPPRLATFSIHPVPPDSAKVAGFSLTPFIFPAHRPIAVYAVDSSGGSIGMDTIPVAFGTSDSTKLGIGTGFDGNADPLNREVFGIRPGRATLYASTTMYGIAKADTLPYRIGELLYGIVGTVKDPRDPHGLLFDRSEITIGTGGMVIWMPKFTFGTADHFDPSGADITFDDPTDVAAVNASPIGLAQLQALSTFLCFFSDCNGSGNIILPSSAPVAALVRAGRIFPVPGIYEFHNSISQVSSRVIVVDERE